MVKLDHISKIYNFGKPNAFQALNNVNLTIEDGALIAIVGTSGAGKSTLLHILACIDCYEEGEYFIDNDRIASCNETRLAQIRNEKIGMVMQDFALIENFTVLQNVMLPLDFSKEKVRDKKEKCIEALKSVGMERFRNSPAGKLSGGQKQRVAIARAIVNQPSLLLADEPTGALDSKTSAEIMELFHQLHQQGKTIVIVTHDADIAAQCERIVRIEDGVMI